MNQEQSSSPPEDAVDPHREWLRSEIYANAPWALVYKVQDWSDTTHTSSEAQLYYEEVIEPWLNDLSKPEPDLFQWIRDYGYTIYISGNWTEPPFNLSKEETERWKKHSLMPATMDDYRNLQMGHAGSVFEMLMKSIARPITLLQRQQTAACERVREVFGQDISAFVPTEWHPDLLDSDDQMQEDRELSRAFDLYEDLFYFRRGITSLRMQCITIDNPDFGLPSVDFMHALVSVPDIEIAKAMSDVEPKMHQIIDMWSRTIMKYSGQSYWQIEPHAPEAFWWRHYTIRKDKNWKPLPATFADE